jgi:hypothetical protein
VRSRILRDPGLRQCECCPGKTQETFPPLGHDSHEDDQGMRKDMNLYEKDPKPGFEGVKWQRAMTTLKVQRRSENIRYEM